MENLPVDFVEYETLSDSQEMDYDEYRDLEIANQ